MTQPAKAQEPTMEEILASIRRIIADDDAAKMPTKAVEPNQPALATPRADDSPLTRPAAKLSPPVSTSSPANGRHDISAMLGSFDAPNTVPAEPAQPDLLDLPDTKQADATSASELRNVDGKADAVFNGPQSPPVTNTVADTRRQFQRNMSDRPLLAASTTAAVDSAFSVLAHSVLAKNARTLDDLVSEMLRPMLKAWLDDNLPDLVERIVRDEIERVSRGRGGTK